MGRGAEAELGPALGRGKGSSRFGVLLFFFFASLFLKFFIY